MNAAAMHPQSDRVSPAVLATEAAILAEEGPHHVNGDYYARQSDAASQRRWEAERRVREVLQKAARLPVCVFCEQTIDETEGRIDMAGALLHANPCAMDAWLDSSSFPTDAELDAELDETYDSSEEAA